MPHNNAPDSTVTRLPAPQPITAQARLEQTQAPVGIFDSGIGGLSVYQHVCQLLPDEHYLYFADSAHVPYGERSGEQICQLTLTAIHWLVAQGCKLVVIACNSASAHALQTARACHPSLPIVGLVPALKPAVLASRTRHVAVLATKATLMGSLLDQVIACEATPRRVQVSKWCDPSLVPWVEAGMPPLSTTAQRLPQQLDEMSNRGVDQLVLGCTHYPFFQHVLQAHIAQHALPLQVIDSGAAIAKRVKQLLAERQLLRRCVVAFPTVTSVPALRFYASRYDTALALAVARLLPMPITVVDQYGQTINQLGCDR